MVKRGSWCRPQASAGSAAWIILLDWTFRSGRPASALSMRTGLTKSNPALRPEIAIRQSYPLMEGLVIIFNFPQGVRPRRAPELTASFDGRAVTYSFGELDTRDAGDVVRLADAAHGVINKTYSVTHQTLDCRIAFRPIS